MCSDISKLQSDQINTEGFSFLHTVIISFTRRLKVRARFTISNGTSALEPQFPTHVSQQMTNSKQISQANTTRENYNLCQVLTA